MKYFQASLAQIASRGRKKENAKFAVYSKTRLFWFRWESCEWRSKKVLEIITDDKGSILYEKIVNIKSLDLNPENWISFDKNKFYSYLKQKVVT